MKKPVKNKRAEMLVMVDGMQWALNNLRDDIESSVYCDMDLRFDQLISGITSLRRRNKEKYSSLLEHHEAILGAIAHEDRGALNYRIGELLYLVEQLKSISDSFPKYAPVHDVKLGLQTRLTKQK